MWAVTMKSHLANHTMRQPNSLSYYIGQNRLLSILIVNGIQDIWRWCYLKWKILMVWMPGIYITKKQKDWFMYISADTTAELAGGHFQECTFEWICKCSAVAVLVPPVFSQHQFPQSRKQISHFFCLWAERVPPQKTLILHKKQSLHLLCKH